MKTQKCFRSRTMITSILAFFLTLTILVLPLFHNKSAYAVNEVDVDKASGFNVTGGTLDYVTEHPLAAQGFGGTDTNFINAVSHGAYAKLPQGSSLISKEIDISTFVGYTSQNNFAGQVGAFPVGNPEQARISVASISYVPQKGWNVGNTRDKFDAESLIVEFSDGVNKFDIKVFYNGDTCLLSKSINGAAFSGDYWINSHLIGYDQATSDYHIPILRVFYDAGTKAFTATNGNQSGYFLGNAPEGFNDTKLTMKIWFETYEATTLNAGVEIFQFLGQNIVDSDVNSPKIKLDAPVKTEYIVGETVQLPNAEFSVGSTKAAAVLTIKDSDGNSVNNGFTCSKQNKYIAEYSYNYNGTKYFKNIAIYSLKNAFSVSSASSSVEYGDYPFNANMPTSYGSGAIATIKSGDKLIINKTIDLSLATVTYNDWGQGAKLYPDFDYNELQTSKPVLSTYFIPSVGYEGGGANLDYRSLNVKFTNIYNSSENFTVNMYNYDFNDANLGYCDFRISEINSVATGRKGIWHASQFNGYNGADFMKEFLNMRIFFDSKTNEVFIGNVTGNGNIATSIGFATGFYGTEVKTEIWFDDYLGAKPAKVMIGRVGGEKVKSLGSLDVTPPTIEVNYGDYTETTLPTYEVGANFTAFLANASDDGAKIDCKVEAYYDYDNIKEAIPVLENKFTISKAGKYTLIYSASDGINKTTKRVDFNAENYFTVTWQGLNGETISTSKIAATTPPSKLIKPVDPTKAGYVFSGWYSDSGFLTAWNFETNTITANTTIYAKFTAVFEVTLDINGVKTSSFVESEYTFTAASVVDKVFFGWNIGGKLYSPTAKIAVTSNVLATAVFGEFKMEKGASIRLQEPSGIRFIANINASSLDNIVLLSGETKVKLGMRIVRGDNKYLDIPAVNKSVVGSNTKFTGVIMNIAPSNYNVTYTGKAYVEITYANEITERVEAEANDNTRTIAGVAQAALNDTTVTYTEAQKAILNKYIAGGK